MGHKMRIATVALEARHAGAVPAGLGTRLRMMLATVPAVILVDQVAKKVSMKLVHGVAAMMVARPGVLKLLNVGQLL